MSTKTDLERERRIRLGRLATIVTFVFLIAIPVAVFFFTITTPEHAREFDENYLGFTACLFAILGMLTYQGWSWPRLIGGLLCGVLLLIVTPFVVGGTLGFLLNSSFWLEFENSRTIIYFLVILPCFFGYVASAYALLGSPAVSAFQQFQRDVALSSGSGDSQSPSSNQPDRTKLLPLDDELLVRVGVKTIRQGINYFPDWLQIMREKFDGAGYSQLKDLYPRCVELARENV